MKFYEKTQSVISTFEIVLAGIMFFVMLISCGMYINIKLNGKVSNLPPLSENDTKMILRSSGIGEDSIDGTLLEPLFIGIKSGDEMNAVLTQREVRESIDNKISEALSVLFEGTSEAVLFESEYDFNNYIEIKKYSSNYMLLGFYKDLPSSIVLPCIVDNYRDESVSELFMFKYIFLLPDKSGNLYASVISDDGVVTELYPSEKIEFGKIVSDSYDVSDGWTKFVYSDLKPLYPVFISSLNIENYTLTTFSENNGADSKQQWVNDLFDIFSINANLVKSFVSGDGSVVNHVEDSGELVIKNDGTVSFKAAEDNGVSLNEFVGYISDTDTKLSLADKLYALKKFVYRTISDEEITCSVVGVNINEADDSTKIYIKYLLNGIFLLDSAFDAVFEIKNDLVINAEFKMVNCTKTDTYTEVIPQKYASFAAMSEVNLFYNYDSENKLLTPAWGSSTYESSKVKENGN